MQSTINNFELFIYFIAWIFANLFSLYKLFDAQTNILKNDTELFYTLGDLKPGWRIISRPKDFSDVEWSTWKYFINHAWGFLIFQFIISEIIRNKNITLLKYWYIISSVIYVGINLGYRQLIIISAQPLLFATLILLGSKKICIWLFGISLLLSFNSLKYKYYFWYILDADGLQDEEVYATLFGVAWIELRCISFCIDYIDKMYKYQKEGCDNNLPTATEILINMYSYVFYLPLLYIGPMILYEDFEKSLTVRNEKLLMRLKRFLCDILLFIIYTFLMELAFHYIYFFAMQDNMKAIRKLPTLALCGGGLWMGLEFHMKYVISYGTTAAFARLDNMDPPPTPRCIVRVHVYSQMWRYFDVGLYKFLVKYIYKPSFATLSHYNKLPKMANKLMASFMTFLFIFLWHGTVRNIFLWSVLNYLGITLEHVGKVVSRSDQYKWFKNCVLKTDQMETRFTALLCTPLLALSAISNFYLFAGSKIGDLFFETIMYPTFWNSLIVGVSLYSCCQISIALKNVSSRTDRKIDNKCN